MKPWHVSSLCIFTLSLLFSINLIAQSTPPPEPPTYFIKVNPAGTYLFTNRHPTDPDPKVQKYLPADSAAAASALNLYALYNDPIFPLNEGDLLGFERVGTYSCCSGVEDTSSGLGGVFSNYINFLTPGPFTNAPAFLSLPTYYNNIPTDIPQDFSIFQNNVVYAQVPKGATQVLFTARDSFFSDNTDDNGDFSVYIKIKIFKPYRLVKEIIIGDTSYDTPPISIAPSKEDGCNSTKPSMAHIRIRCLKKIPGSTVEEAAAGCKIQTSLSLGNFLGGHDEGHDQSTRLMGKFAPNTNEDFIEIPKIGLDLKYFASQVSGGYAVRFDGRDPDDRTINLVGTGFSVQLKDLTPLNDLLMFKALAPNNTESHPGDGYYGTPLLRDRLSIALAKYREDINNFNEILRNGPTNEAFARELTTPVIQSEAASLRWGGAYDVNKNWNAPHCTHRNGKHIDISMSPFDNDLQNVFLRTRYKKILAKAFLEDEKFVFGSGEEPNRYKDHWHAQIPNN